MTRWSKVQVSMADVHLLHWRCSCIYSTVHGHKTLAALDLTCAGGKLAGWPLLLTHVKCLRSRAGQGRAVASSSLKCLHQDFQLRQGGRRGGQQGREQATLADTPWH